MDIDGKLTVEGVRTFLAEKGIALRSEGEGEYRIGFKGQHVDDYGPEEDLRGALMSGIAEANWRDTLLEKVEKAGYQGEFNPRTLDFTAKNEAGEVVFKGDGQDVSDWAKPKAPNPQGQTLDTVPAPKEAPEGSYVRMTSRQDDPAILVHKGGVSFGSVASVKDGFERRGGEAPEAPKSGYGH